MTKYVVIDTSNLIHRVRHSIQRYDSIPELVSMVAHTFFLSLNKSYKKFNADHLVLCFDEGSPYWRGMFLYPDYKLSRRTKKLTRTPEEILIDKAMGELLDYLYEFFKNKTNVTALREYGIEADDFISRWTQLHPDDNHVIVSSDTDFRQLVSSNVEQYSPIDDTLYTNNGVYVQDGVRVSRRDIVVQLYGDNWKVKKDKKGEIVTFDPEWDLFFKCIRGDSSDFIKSSYPRVRETRLKEVFAKRGSLEWNKFLGEQWDKNDDDSPIVKDRYLFNKALIDLTQQPEEILELLDEVIESEIMKTPTNMGMVAFGKLCRKYKLAKMMDYISIISKAISARYE